MRGPRLVAALALAAGLLGFMHVALTPLAFATWTIDALWFAGSGLAIIAAAGANLIGFHASDLRRRAALTVINLAMGGFFAAAWLVLPEPQVIIGGALFFSLAVATLPLRKVAANAA
ncbi:hypothetical protein [Erythrobacter sp. R86502]|uniref:hypothetical protein n=1 Tax=Erythrobacter sp. R86502 TaxID=3093846 RepID=UPI0036D2D42C